MSLTPSRRVSLSRLRKPTADDAVGICCQLMKATDKVPDKEVARDLDHEEVVRRIVQEEVTSVIIDEAILVVYGIGSPWYADKLYVEEMLVLRLHGGGTFMSVTDFLEDIADMVNADAVIVASALAYSSRALAKLYTRQGFKQEQVTLAKRRH